jgi:hypothetical protein
MNELKIFSINHGQDTKHIDNHLATIKELLEHTTHGFVYALNYKGITKIGFSKRPHSRLKELTTSQGIRDYQFAAFETFDAMKLERVAHAHFHSMRIDNCEWFSISFEDAYNFLSSATITIPYDVESLIESSKDREKKRGIATQELIRDLTHYRSKNIANASETISHKEVADDQGFCIYKKDDGSIWLYTCNQDLHEYKSINEAIAEIVNNDFIDSGQTFEDVECYFFGFDKNEMLMLFNLEIIKFIQNKISE